MAPRTQKPRTVVVEGVARHVVKTTPTTWIEQLPSGRLVHHAGKLLDNQTIGQWLDEPKPCTRCRQPSHTATPRGRAVHDTCEGWLNVLPDDVYAQVVFGVAADLGAHILSSTPLRRPRHAAAA